MVQSWLPGAELSPSSPALQPQHTHSCVSAKNSVRTSLLGDSLPSNARPYSLWGCPARWKGRQADSHSCKALEGPTPCRAFPRSCQAQFCILVESPAAGVSHTTPQSLPLNGTVWNCFLLPHCPRAGSASSPAHAMGSRMKAPCERPAAGSQEHQEIPLCSPRDGHRSGGLTGSFPSLYLTALWLLPSCFELWHGCFPPRACTKGDEEPQ